MIIELKPCGWSSPISHPLWWSSTRYRGWSSRMWESRYQFIWKKRDDTGLFWTRRKFVNATTRSQERMNVVEETRRASKIVFNQWRGVSSFLEILRYCLESSTISVVSNIKSLDEGFSTFSMVCACLNPPPCIKGAFFFPSSKVLVSQPYSSKTFPYSKDFSGPSVFPQWRLALKAAIKK